MRHCLSKVREGKERACSGRWGDEQGIGGGGGEGGGLRYIQDVLSESTSRENLTSWWIFVFAVWGAAGSGFVPDTPRKKNRLLPFIIKQITPGKPSLHPPQDTKQARREDCTYIQTHRTDQWQRHSQRPEKHGRSESSTPRRQELERPLLPAETTRTTPAQRRRQPRPQPQPLRPLETPTSARCWRTAAAALPVRHREYATRPLLPPLQQASLGRVVELLL